MRIRSHFLVEYRESIQPFWFDSFAVLRRYSFVEWSLLTNSERRTAARTSWTIGERPLLVCMICLRLVYYIHTCRFIQMSSAE